MLDHVPWSRSWDREFDAAVLRRRSSGALLFQHDVVREGSVSYPYRHRSHWGLLSRLFRKRRVAVQSICPPGRQALESAFSEVRSLILEANRAYAGSAMSREHIWRERDVALQQLERAIDHFESHRSTLESTSPAPPRSRAASAKPLQESPRPLDNQQVQKPHPLHSDRDFVS